MIRASILTLFVAQSTALVLPTSSSYGLARSSPQRASVFAQTGAAPTKEEIEKAQAQRLEALSNQVDAMLTEFPKKLAPGVAPPAGMAKLEEAFKAKDASQMFIGIYEVTIEGELMYQVNADELLEPLDESDIDWTNKDDEVVKAKMKYLYGMGLRMLGSAGPETSEKIKQLVLDKLVSKVGMEGKAFDDWLL